MRPRGYVTISVLLSTVWFIWDCNRDKRGELLPLEPATIQHENSVHQHTWLSYSSANANTQEQEALRKEIVLIATAIAQYEPVNILVKKEDQPPLQALFGKLATHHYPITLVDFATNSTRLREIGPLYVHNQAGERAAINFHFRPLEPQKVPNNTVDFLTQQSQRKSIHSNLRLDGGSLVVDDKGTAIMTENHLYDKRHNRYWGQTQIENELKTLLGLKKIIWLPELDEKEALHTDAYVRFAKEGVVLVHQENNKKSPAYRYTRTLIKTLQNQTDALGHPIQVIPVEGPEEPGERAHQATYLGYYLCNHALIMQRFGDPKYDQKARATLQKLFPHKSIEMLNLNAFASTGATLHTLTLEEPTF